MTNHWTEGLFYSLDLESTSPDPLDSHAVSCTLVKFDGGRPVDKREWVIKPAVEVPQGAIDVHGLTNEYLAENGMDAATALEEILAMTAQVMRSGCPLVVFNAPYDLTVLEKQAEYYGLKSLMARTDAGHWDTIIDPLVLAKGLEHIIRREFVKGRNFKLPSLCERYGVEFEETHDATADAIGAGLLAVKLIEAEDELYSKGPKALTATQIRWRDRDMESLRKYFSKVGNEEKASTVDAGWPLHSAVVS